MLMAIGEPELVDTTSDSRLSRIFSNKVIRRYPAFADFHGMEDCIEQIVSYFRHAAQGLEEKKQILYLLGPVGGGKSSLAEKLKHLIEKIPFYAIKGSPVFESPLGLFNPDEDGQILEEDYGIPRHYLRSIMSPTRSPSPRPSRATRTTRTSPPWWARWTSASWRNTRRTMRTPTAIPAPCAGPTRA